MPTTLNLQNATTVYQSMSTAENFSLYQALSSASEVKEIHLDTQYLRAPGYRLIRVDGRSSDSTHGFEIALLCDVDTSVAYYHQVTVIPSPAQLFHSTTVHQPWISPFSTHSSALCGIFQKVLFNYILNRYDAVFAENNHIIDIGFFWQRQMSAALAKGFYVYYFPASRDKIQLISTQEELSELLDGTQPNREEGESHRILMSKIKIDIGAL